MIKQVLTILVDAFKFAADSFTKLINGINGATIIVSVIAFMLLYRMIIAPLLGSPMSIKPINFRKDDK